MSFKKIIQSKKAPSPIGPYSQAVIANGILYASGMIAINPETGDLDIGNIENESKRVMDNIGHVLSAAGVSYEHIIKCSIFLSDMNNFAKVNEVYGSYFISDPPARETVEVARLPKNVNVEISIIAQVER